MKRIISAILILSVLLTAAVFSGCSKEDLSDKQLTVYCTTQMKKSYEQLFKYYNSYCLSYSQFGKPYQISFVEFETDEELYKKMTTETMAGGGPDIFLTEQYLPFEKMIGAGAFMNIDELLEREGYKIDFSELNEKVMDSGVWNGKRYILPIVYSARVMSIYKYSLEAEDMFDKKILSDKNGYTVTYSDIKNMLNYAEKSPLFNYDSYGLMCNLLYDYMDMKEKKIYFDTDEFKENLEIVKKLHEYEVKREEKMRYMDEDELWDVNDPLFSNSQESFIDFMGRYLCDYTEESFFPYYSEESEQCNVLYKGVSKDKTDNRGNIDLGIAINKNTKQGKKICEFIKFSLSNLGQSHMTSPYNGFAFGSSFPVNKKTFEKRLRNAMEFEFVGGDVFKNHDSEMFNTYVEIARSVDDCGLYSGSSYYTTSIVGELIEQYLNGKLPQNKFIRQLTSATKFYLEE